MTVIIFDPFTSEKEMNMFIEGNIRSLNEYRDLNKNSLLHIAVEKDYLSSVKLLLRNNINREMRNNQYKKPIDIAYEEGKTDIISLLLSNSKFYSKKTLAAEIYEKNILNPVPRIIRARL